MLVNVPVGTGYRVYVFYRPTVGSGAWGLSATGAPGTVDVTAAAFTAITVAAPPAGATAVPQGGDSVTVDLDTPTYAVTEGEFAFWVVSPRRRLVRRHHRRRRRHRPTTHELHDS